MKTLNSLFALLCALCAIQSHAAVEVINHTSHKIEATRMNGPEDSVGYSVTIDGKKSIFGMFFIMAGGTERTLEELTEMSTVLPAIPHDVSKLEFSNSELCPGSASGEVLEAYVTPVDGDEYMLCFASGQDYGKNHFYVAFDISH